MIIKLKVILNNSILIISLNIFTFLINIYFLTRKNKYKFNNVDLFQIYHLRKSFIQISNFLNTKYFYNKKVDINNSQTRNNKEKIILIDFVDFLYNNKKFIGYLRHIFPKNRYNYKFVLDTNNPDYVIFDVFGCQHNNPKYNRSIKIAFFSENILPDFNEADYALAHAHFFYLDRYFKYPSYIWNFNKYFHYRKYNLEKIRKEVLKSSIRSKFCAAVISSNYSFQFRLDFIKELNKYKKVDMGGKAYNNIGSKVLNKINFLSSYKFSIAMENTDGDGYITEKILESFIAGTIPIYYGNYMVDEYINPKAYILIKGKKDIKNKINYIKKIDNDNNLYMSILREKVFLWDNVSKIIENERLLFFQHIFEQNINFSKRIDDSNRPLKCELEENYII